MGCNLSYILWKFRDKCVVLSSHSVDYYAELLYKWKVNNRETNCDTNLIVYTLLELADIRDEIKSMEYFNKEECIQMIESLCTS